MKINKNEYELTGNTQLKDDAENVRFAWRPLEISNRLQDQTSQFQLFLVSPSFTPEFLTEFLLNYHKHANYYLSDTTLTRETTCCLSRSASCTPATFFPEFKEAADVEKERYRYPEP